ncbi:hypothetical protein COC42_05055 [Sphingomonas spermidinifaciens]|uniref:DUF2490 domain-containing protein n=1 Tax=Sphingomonas spermidinifaciens TaxID=1141889 RepID=A0A2A4B5K9_9SPHN|nr:DUF2490 domain-containing protein [Sphingomonas spermidinifaciens]PCD03721.1 hypothetical protein COC42_05055 [Sphingomonas spermidinifaciens]
MRHLLSLAAALAAASPALAEDDVQAWGAFTASGAVKGDLFVWGEGQLRLTDDAGGGSQILVRPAIGARIARDAHAVIGYSYIPTDPQGGVATRENRVWQQVQFVPLRNRGGVPLVISRTRLEQRMIEGREETGWRLRQFVRLQAPIARQGTVLAVAYTEGFFNLNSTNWGARNGIDQWRNFVGIGFPLAPKLRIEPGYLNQTVFRAGENRSNHVANVALFLSL